MQLSTLVEHQFKHNETLCLPQINLNKWVIQKLLDINTNNIPPVKNKINLYADHMINGRWKYNGDSIRISKEGVLLDGQNRLLAAQKAHVDLVCDLVVGLDDDTFNTIDQGRVRQTGHLVAREFSDLTPTDARQMSVGVNKILKHRYSLAQTTTGGSEGKYLNKFTADEAIHYIYEHPEIIEEWEWVKKTFSKRDNLSPPTILYIYHIGSRWNKEYTQKWLKKSVKAIGLVEGEALHIANQLFNEVRAKSLRLTQAEFEGLLFKTWNKVAEKGLKAITTRAGMKLRVDEHYVHFIEPSERALIEMSNSL
jgi:hypothetical protein